MESGQTRNKAVLPFASIQASWDELGRNIDGFVKNAGLGRPRNRVQRGPPPFAAIALQEKWQELSTKVKTWVARQPPAVEVAVITLGSSIQGGFIGGLMGSLASDLDTAPPGNVPLETAEQMKKLKALAGGPASQARNFAVMTGVNAGISCAMRRIRKGKEDVANSMVSAFGSGVAYAFVSGVGGPIGPSALGTAVSTGVGFAVLQGAFYKLGERFSPKPANDIFFEQTKGILLALGLQQYERNFRNGQLTDQTLPLLTESVLREVKIPPGPRLLILDAVKKEHKRKPALTATATEVTKTL